MTERERMRLTDCAEDLKTVLPDNAGVHLTKAEIYAVLRLFWDRLYPLTKGNDVVITGVGVFSRQTPKARTFKDPQTGEVKQTIPAERLVFHRARTRGEPKSKPVKRAKG
jgi:nucleoid DNA-binding protein